MMATNAVLLVNPNRMEPPIAPLALEHLAAGLERGGYTPLLCDLSFEADWQGGLVTALQGCDPLAVAVTVRNLDDAYFASQDFILAQTAEIIRELQQLSDAPIILGGVGFSIAPEAILTFTGADYGIVGEGEAALPHLLDALANGKVLSSVPGLVYWDANTLRRNPSAFMDLSGHPPLPRTFLDNPRYFAEGGQLGLETKRGCGMPCVYCVEPEAQGQKIRPHPPEQLVMECEALLAQGLDVLHLCDSEFNLPYSHAMAVCEAFITAGLGERLRWYAYAYPAHFDRALAEAMRAAGCVGINFGVDHADPAMLQRLGRRYTPEDIRTTFAACRAADITTMFDLLLGSPGETRESLATAINFMRDLGVDRVGLSCGVRVYPSTALAKAILAQGPLADNPNLHGTTTENDDLLKPIFFVESGVNGDIHDIVSELVDGDPRFLHANPNELDGNYNYNDNSVLSQAIQNGARGAYWDILRKLG